MKYRITSREIWERIVEVEAESKAAALLKFNDSDTLWDKTDYVSTQSSTIEAVE
ncbi:hypothetical protein LCGC14_2299660 [marine sediment metagenome]|uniref:Uncharacterized protein n=1 Tax=marine sediment metagenome TaxID=412755 RepID=A0A0F9CPB4_9ZZZZ